MASAVLSRRVKKVVAYPPLSEMGDRQRREFHEALLDADRFEDLPGKVAGGDPKGRSEPAPTCRSSTAASSRVLMPPARFPGASGAAGGQLPCHNTRP
jgi:hypothetical protein